MKSEVLAPAGDYESFIAAVQNGADAVYLAGPHFGARKFAKNFDEEALIDVIKYAHIREVSVYVTVNTLIKDTEFEDVKKYIDFLYRNDVDAVITQDMGLAMFIVQNYPDLALHASTQMSAHSVDDVKYLKSIGFSRVVLARELSFDEIKEIKEQVDIEIEVFVHGALCVSYSGQCLMSSTIGGRSGNRGSCAQPCRQLYDYHEKSYAISPMDLNTLKHASEMSEIGVTSLKIEGRMKGPEYVSTIVRAYKSVLEGHSYKDYIGDLKRIFNRSYTEGFIFEDKKIIASDAPGNRGEFIGTVKAYDAKERMLTIDLRKSLYKGDEIQIRRLESSVGARTDVFYEGKRRLKSCPLNEVDVEFKYPAHVGEAIFRTYDAEWMDSRKQTYHKEFRKVDVQMYAELILGLPAQLVLSDGEHEVSVSSQSSVEKALKVALDGDRLEKQLSKLGSTPYRLSKLDYEMDSNITISAKELNEMRRHATDLLDRKREKRYRRDSHEVKEILCKARPVHKKQVTVAVKNRDQYEAIKDWVDIIYYADLNDIPDEATPRLPRITHQAQLDALDYKDALVGSYGQYHKMGGTLDYSLNIFNQRSICHYQTRMTLSYELSKEEIMPLYPCEDNALEMIVYGHQPLMIMKYCPIIKGTMQCANCLEKCQDHQVLKDRFDHDYPMIRNGNRLEILNYERLHLLDRLKELEESNIEFYRLDFTLESPEEVFEITKAYLAFLEGKNVHLDLQDATYGHFDQGVQ